MGHDVVRAKFTCNSQTKRRDGSDKDGNPTYVYDYNFSAVTGGSEENKLFWKWTPSGNVTLNTVLDGAFEVGQEYYLDFSRAVEPVKAV